MQRDLPTPAVAVPPRPLFDTARAGSSLALVLVAVGLVVLLVTIFNLRVTGVAAVALIPVGAIVATRHPVAAVLALFLVMGFSATLVAFTPIQSRPALDFLLLSLWLGVLWSFLSGRERRLWLWPALLAPVLYIALVLAQALLTDPPSRGFESFRLLVWPMTSMLLVALAPWSDATKLRMVRAALLAGLAVGCYAVYRWFAGPAPGEEAIARGAMPGIPNLRFYGPMSTAGQLAQWSGTLLPFALGLALGWRGRWRLAAASVVGLCAFLVVATEVRTGTVAVVAGIALTLLLFQLAAAFPGGTRVGTSLAGALVVATLGVGAFTIAVGGNDDRVERFERILTPGEDKTFSKRIDRWSDAWPRIMSEPLGHGLGTHGSLEQTADFVPEIASVLDNSYLQIGFEQGPIAMALFVFALLLLLISLAQRAISVSDPERAAIAIGACGSLLALLVFLYAGSFLENRQVLLAWILIGLAIAQFTTPDPDPAPGDPRRR